MKDVIEQAEAAIQLERSLWAVLIDTDDGTPVYWKTWCGARHRK